MLESVEGDDADGIVELARQEIADHGPKIGALGLRFSARTQAVHDQVDRFIRAIRHDGF